MACQCIVGFYIETLDSAPLPSQPCIAVVRRTGHHETPPHTLEPNNSIS